MSITGRLSKKASLWTSFVLVIITTITFPVVASVWNISFIDAISDPDQIRENIVVMSANQRFAHAWITGTLDVFYPIVYGALFIGSAHAFYGRYASLVALPFFILVPVDLLEGLVQILALAEIRDWVDAKAVLTPLKNGLFLLGALVTVLGWVIWLFKRLIQ